MPDRPYNLAIETSSRIGSVAVGRGDACLATVDLPDPMAPPRRSVDLMPTIDALLREHGITKQQLGEVYVSLGPGSFTGLRIAVTTAKMLARVLDVRIVGVPTLDVVAVNQSPAQIGPHLAVCLNLKRDSVYAGLYHHDSSEGDQSTANRTVGNWTVCEPPALTSLTDLLARAPRPLTIVGNPLPALPTDADDVIVLPSQCAVPDARAVWQLGRAAARQQTWTEPATLVPLYVRPPEAVELWDKRHGKQN